MVAILLENRYSDSLWCKKIHSALMERLRTKRIAFCEIYDSCPRNIKSVFIIGSDYTWLKSTIKQFNKNDIIPIVLCNQSDPISGCIYNCVCADVTASMTNILNTLKSKGKKKIAIYGVNPSSLPDISRTDTLMLSKDDTIEKMTVFVNEGSLTECFNNFYSVADEYDCVVCTNDFAAISLVKHLKDKNRKLLDKLFIFSCTASKFLDQYREYITSLDVNYNHYGKAAVYIYEAIKKHNYISGLTVKVEWDLSFKRSSSVSKKIVLDTQSIKNTFYDDPELIDMLIVDKLHTFSDETDKIILDALLENLSIEEISQKCFLSINAIKYRIKNLIENSGARDKRHLINLLRAYND